MTDVSHLYQQLADVSLISVDNYSIAYLPSVIANDHGQPDEAAPALYE